jgi:putative oxidoreductase
MSERPFMEAWAPRLLSVLRIVVGAMFIQHGSQKLFGALGGTGPGQGAVALMSQMGVAGVLEFFGGLLLLLGLFTRPVAFLLSGMMAVAYFQFHAPGSFFPVVNKGELAVVYCFLFLYLCAAGGGPWSVDSLLARRVRK